MPGFCTGSLNLVGISEMFYGSQLAAIRKLYWNWDIEPLLYRDPVQSGWGPSLWGWVTLFNGVPLLAGRVRYQQLKTGWDTIYKLLEEKRKGWLELGLNQRSRDCSIKPLCTRNRVIQLALGLGSLQINIYLCQRCKSTELCYFIATFYRLNLGKFSILQYPTSRNYFYIHCYAIIILFRLELWVHALKVSNKVFQWQKTLLF